MYIGEGSENQSALAWKSRQSVQSMDRWAWSYSPLGCKDSDTHTQCMYMPFFFVYSSDTVIWIIPSFAIVNNAAVNVSFYVSAFSSFGCNSWVLWKLCLIFWESIKLFSTSLPSFYFTIRNAGVFQFLYFHISWYFLFFFSIQVGKMVSHCGFYLAFS